MAGTTELFEYAEVFEYSVMFAGRPTFYLLVASDFSDDLTWLAGRLAAQRTRPAGHQARRPGGRPYALWISRS